MGFLEEDQRSKVPFSSHLIKGTINKTYHCWCKSWLPGWGSFVRFLHCKVTFRPCLFTVFFERKSPCAAHISGGCVMFHFLRESIYINALNSFCMGDLSFLSHFFIYSIIYLYQHRLMDIYFILWVIIQQYLIFLIKFFQLWPSGKLELSQCPKFSVDLCPFIVCACVFSFSLSSSLSPSLFPSGTPVYFLALQAVPGLSCIFCPILGLAISPKSPDFFY